MFDAAKAWNDIPHCITHVDLKDDFKMTCKSYLFKIMQGEENNKRPDAKWSIYAPLIRGLLYYRLKSQF